jgi:hypothetical protein
MYRSVYTIFTSQLSNSSLEKVHIIFKIDVKPEKRRVESGSAPIKPSRVKTGRKMGCAARELY